jgi:Fe-S-cluster containining protein
MSDYKNKKPFPCIHCGLCCRTLKNVPEAAHLHNGNGVCTYLEGNLCTIYETRPLICNIEAMYVAYFRKAMTWTEFISMNIRSCIIIAELHKDSNAMNKLLALDIY